MPMAQPVPVTLEQMRRARDDLLAAGHQGLPLERRRAYDIGYMLQLLIEAGVGAVPAPPVAPDPLLHAGPPTGVDIIWGEPDGLLLGSGMNDISDGRGADAVFGHAGAAIGESFLLFMDGYPGLAEAFAVLGAVPDVFVDPAAPGSDTSTDPRQFLDPGEQRLANIAFDAFGIPSYGGRQFGDEISIDSSVQRPPRSRLEMTAAEYERLRKQIPGVEIDQAEMLRVKFSASAPGDPAFGAARPFQRRMDDNPQPDALIGAYGVVGGDVPPCGSGE